MEGERFLMAAGVTAAVVVGAYVLWGPSGGTRLRKRRGQVGGLHNLGRTCFLNAVLQALAACTQFKLWLQKFSGRDSKSLITTLNTVIEVVNGTHVTIRSDPYTPGDILQSLFALGWVIPPDEQDAHELLHVILSSLEEEINKPVRKIGCLSDALGLSDYSLLPTRPSSAMMVSYADRDVGPWPETPDTAPQSPPYPPLSNYTRSEVHTPNSPHSPDGEIDFDSQINLYEVAASASSTRKSRPRYISERSSLSKRSSISCRSLERVGSCVRMALFDEVPKEPNYSIPFHGTLATQFKCKECGFKTPIRYDKFDSISLHLLSDLAGCSLLQLLYRFVSPEIVKDFLCEKCNKREPISVSSIEQDADSISTSSSSEDSQVRAKLTSCIKTIYFGKLPQILCIHIPRTMWREGGNTYKRMEYVSFPENLNMSQFTYLQSGFATRNCNSGSMSLPRDSGDLHTPAYRLVSVVVHVGDTETGHFITYRRGSMRNMHKWYFTSDAAVREVSLNEVLQSVAYMLFYEKCM